MLNSYILLILVFYLKNLGVQPILFILPRHRTNLNGYADIDLEPIFSNEL